MSSRRTERLLNLVICLLATPRWLTKEQIRASVPQYAGDSDEAFNRMFERDKEDLRELGIPIATRAVSSGFDDEVGYRISRQDYELPPVELDAEELAVLGLAARVWQQASLAGPATRALAKLTALGLEPDTDSLVGVEPRVRTAEPAFDALFAATRDRAPVAFRYRKPDGSVSDRRLEPWALTSASGRWYVVGRDRDRDAARVFRLSRIDGDVRRNGRAGGYQPPLDLDARAMVRGTPGDSDPRQATVRVPAGRVATLRRRAEQVVAEGGHDLLTLRIGDTDLLAEQLAGMAPDAVVLDPPDLRAAVLDRLRGAREAQRAAPAVLPGPAGSPGAADRPEGAGVPGPVAGAGR